MAETEEATILRDRVKDGRFEYAAHVIRMGDHLLDLLAYNLGRLNGSLEDPPDPPEFANRINRRLELYRGGFEDATRAMADLEEDGVLQYRRKALLQYIEYNASGIHDARNEIKEAAYKLGLMDVSMGLDMPTGLDILGADVVERYEAGRKDVLTEEAEAPAEGVEGE